MYRYFLFFIGILFLTVSCQTSETKKGNSLVAETPGVEEGTAVYLLELGKGSQPIALDTAMVKEGKVELTLPKVDFQTLNFLTVEGKTDNLPFINENRPLHVRLDPEQIRNSEVEGGKANEIFKEYWNVLNEANQKFIAMTDGLTQDELQDPASQQQVRQLQQRLEKETSDFRKKSIKENPDQFTSILLFNDMMRSQQVPQAEMKELYEGLSKRVQNTYIGKEIGTELAKSDAVAIGKKAPSFSAKTPEGKELALEDALGKYTLLDFWAAWCLPCRHENPNIVRVYDQYKDKGFEVLGVSLDKDRDKWLEAIQKDNLTWNQVSNLQFWQDPIAQDYNIKAIPANFLLDENGTIIATNLRGMALEEKIRELLDN